MINPTPSLILCQSCHLYKTCKHPVNGEGYSPCDILILGEAPGKNENDEGRPFIGMSGRLLRQALETEGLTNKQLYITNSVKCWPNDNGKNRKPTTSEIKACNSWLKAEIAVLEPKWIVALGDTALKALGITEKITAARTKELDYNGIPVLAAFHPSYALRGTGNMQAFLQDIARIARTVGLEGKRTTVDYAEAKGDIGGFALVAVDTEFYDGVLECFSFSNKADWARVVFSDSPTFIQDLRNLIFQSEVLLMHNAPADVPLICKTLGISNEEFPWYKIIDTMVIAYCTGQKGKDVGLKQLAQVHLGKEVTSLDEVWDKQSPLSTIDRDWLINYACQDADLTISLYPILLEVLRNVGT